MSVLLKEMVHIIDTSQKFGMPFHLNFQEGNGWGTDFMMSNPLSPCEQVTVNFEGNTINLPDYFEANGVPIVHNRFLSALKNVDPENYQFIPLVINFYDSKVEGYGVLNILKQVDCLDKEQSEYSTRRSSIARIFKLKLNLDNINGAQIFRDPLYRDIVFISDSLKAEIETIGIRGVIIRPADGWSDSYRF